MALGNVFNPTAGISNPFANFSKNVKPTKTQQVQSQIANPNMSVNPSATPAPNMSTVNGPAVGKIVGSVTPALGPVSAPMSTLSPSMSALPMMKKTLPTIPAYDPTKIAGFNAPVIGNQFSSIPGSEKTQFTNFPEATKQTIGQEIQQQNSIQPQPSEAITLPENTIPDLIASINTHPEATVEDIQKYFPELKGNENTFPDLLASLKAHPDATPEQIKQYFPELSAAQVESKGKFDDFLHSTDGRYLRAITDAIFGTSPLYQAAKSKLGVGSMPEGGVGSIPTVNPVLPYTGNEGAFEYMGGTLANTPGSALNIASGLTNMALHPYETAKMGVKLLAGAGANLGIWGLEKTTGKSEEDIKNKVYNEANPIYTFLRDKMGIDMKDNEEVADTIGTFMTERYGGWENIKKTFKEDPVGIVGDVVSLFEGGVNVAGKVGLISEATKVAKMAELSKINPYIQIPSVAAKLVGKLTDITGLTSKTATVVADVKRVSEIEDIAGRIVQGQTKDKAIAAKALSNIDTKGVKTYSDLSTKIGEREFLLAKAVDNETMRDSKLYSPSDFDKKIKVGDQQLTQNFVEKGLDHLEELYKTTDDLENLAKIKDIHSRFNSEGLSITDTNNIARLYNREFGSKAFSKMGDPLTSVNAQSYENIRSGIKEAVRSKLPDEKARILDKEYSEAANTKNLVDKMVEKVNKLEQSVQKRGIVERTARLVGRTVDTLTAGGVKGFLTSFLPSNVGNKVMNALDIQESLQSNLKRLESAIKKIDNGTISDSELKSLFIKDTDGVVSTANNSSNMFTNNEQSSKIKALPNKETVSISNIGTDANPIVANSPKKQDIVELSQKNIFNKSEGNIFTEKKEVKKPGKIKTGTNPFAK